MMLEMLEFVGLHAVILQRMEVLQRAVFIEELVIGDERVTL